MKRLGIVLCLTLAWVPKLAHGSEIAPYLEDSTLAVLRIDLDQVDVAATIANLEEFLPSDFFSEQARTNAIMFANGIVASLRQHGVEHVYATVSARDLVHAGVAVFVPASDQRRVAEAMSDIAAMMPATLGYQVKEVDGGVLLAPPEIAQRLQRRPGAQRPELEQALLLDPATISIACGLRKDLRQTAVNLLSDDPLGELPVEFSPKQLVADVESVAIQINAPELTFKGVLKATDPRATARLENLATQYLELLGPTDRLETIDDTVQFAWTQTELVNILPMLSRAGRQTVASTQESNNLKQVVLAMWNFESQYGVLPPRMSVSESGTPLLSWRVHLLPFLGESELYGRFHLDEAWDSPHNIQLLDQIPPPYQSREYLDLQPGMTCLQQPLSAGSIWSGEEQSLRAVRDVRDGTSNTLAFVLADARYAVPWTKPADLEIAPDRPLENLFGERDQIGVALLDGSVHTLRRSETNAKRILAALTYQGGEALQLRTEP